MAAVNSALELNVGLKSAAAEANHYFAALEQQRTIAQLQQKEQVLEQKLDQELKVEAQLREQEGALSRAHLELQSRVSELVRFNRAAIGREMRIIELKGEVNALREQLGQRARYSLEFDPQPPAPIALTEEPTDCQEALVPLEAILHIEQLAERTSRPADHKAEIQALMALVQALADAPQTILQTLAQTALQLLQAGSAGLSLLTKDGKRFYWAVIAGQWSPHLGGGTPRGFGPCGDVLDRNMPLLFSHWERRYPYLAEALPLAEEGLLVPFHVEGRPVGTIWVIAHTAQRRFDAEDLRLLESLARFASVAYQATEYLGLIEERRAALNLLEDVVQSQAQAEQSNRQLREREEQLRLATQAAEVGLWDVDPITDTLFWPASVKAMFGISPDVPVSMADFYSGLHPADRERTSGALAAALDPARRALYDVEYRTVGKEDGQIRWVAAKGRGLFDGEGRCVRVLGAAVDITARKFVEESLVQRDAWLAGHKEAFQAAINGAPLPSSLGILTRTVVEHFEGEARCAFYIADAEGKGLHHVVGMCEEYARAVEGFRIGSDSISCGLAVHRGEPIFTFDVTEEPLWKPWAWLAQQTGFRGCWSYPVETLTGKVVGSCALYFAEPREASSRDRELLARISQAAAIIISHHQETEERARATSALEMAGRQKDEFLAMLAHELRNPLSPITHAGEVLSRTVTGDQSAQFAIGMIKRQTAQLTRLVDDLLDIGRITQGRVKLQLKPVDLTSVIAQAVETVELQLRDKQHEISILTSASRPLYVHGDFVRLVQCFGNILANAVKYTDPGGKIRVETRPDGPGVIVEISDNGAGIPAELLPRVFDLFVQNERTLDRAQGGLGIGLSIVKNLIEMHGGEVRARSAGLQQGSTFEIRLPQIARPGAAVSDATALRAAPQRILIVDDNADAADSLAMLLKIQGHQPHVVYGAEEALACIETVRPDTVLLDIGLPKMNGYELAKRLRAHPQLHGLRLIALTGYGQAEDQQRVRAAGCDVHLIKPVDLAALDRALVAVPRGDSSDS